MCDSAIHTRNCLKVEVKEIEKAISVCHFFLFRPFAFTAKCSHCEPNDNTKQKAHTHSTVTDVGWYVREFNSAKRETIVVLYATMQLQFMYSVFFFNNCLCQ